MSKFTFMPSKAPQKVYDCYVLTKNFLSGIEVIDGGVKVDPLRDFMNSVPRVRDEKVVQPTGMPPVEWAIV